MYCALLSSPYNVILYVYKFVHGASLHKFHLKPSMESLQWWLGTGAKAPSTTMNYVSCMLFRLYQVPSTRISVISGILVSVSIRKFHLKLSMKRLVPNPHVVSVVISKTYMVVYSVQRVLPYWCWSRKEKTVLGTWLEHWSFWQSLLELKLDHCCTLQ